MQVGAAILAGGKSRRMGQNKAGLLIDGETFLARLAAQLSDFPERLLSADSGALPGFASVPDLFPGCGPLGGLHGLLSVCRSDALLIVSCDTPLFSRELGRFLAESLFDRDDAVVPVTRDARVHPVCGVYRKTVLPQLQNMLESGDYRMMALLRQIRTRRVPLEETPFPDVCLLNVNTPQTYRALGGCNMP